MGLFGQAKGKDPKEQVREWQRKLRQEGRVLDRQIQGIHREEAKVKTSLKQAAKKGDTDVCKILAKEIVRSRKAVNKIHTAKAQMKSVEYGMQQQLSTIKVAGCMEKSAQVMTSMQSLIKVTDVQKTMMDMSREMMKAGIIEEMLEDTMEDALEDEDLEEDAQAEVDKILYEITAGKLGEAPDAGSDSLPSGATASAAADSDDEEVEVGEMQARLEALRS